MDDSYKLVILKKLTEWLQAITPTNGYDFDFSACVHRDINVFGDETKGAIINITDAARSGDALFVGQNEDRTEQWYLLIEGVSDIEDVFNPGDSLRNMAAAVEKRLLEIPQTYEGFEPPAGYLLDKTIEAIRVLPHTVRPASEVVPKAFFYQPIILSIVRPSS